MKYARALLLVLFTVVLPLSVHAQERRGMQIVPKNQRFALLVGINKYNRPFTSLKYCDADMEALEKVLLELDFQPENIVRLSTSSRETSLLPTKANILTHARHLAEEVGENGMFIVAFSGHGASFGDESYFCPMDAANKDLNSLVKRSDVYEIVENCRAKQKLVFVDACRNSLVMQGWKAVGGIKGLVDPVGIENPGFFIISSCKTGQFSWEDKDLGHGVFTHFLLEGLQGKAAQDGEISVHALFSYINYQTKHFVRLNFEDSQTPLLRGNEEELDDFLIAVIEPKPNSKPNSKPTVEPAPAAAVATPAETAPPGSSRPAGDRMVLTDDGIEYAFRWCPPGEFMMGSPSSEEKHQSNETLHKVILTKGFWMLETEVTQAMWESVMGKTVRQQRDEVDPQWPMRGEGANYPIYYVNWDECEDFCRKLTLKLGREVKLPTEAQWEYACRAGTTTPFNFGNSLNGDEANCEGNYPYGTSQKGPYKGTAVPVRNYEPNPWGLYDMHGNVWEWCTDCYDASYYGKAPTKDPENLTPSDISPGRVSRGGSWYIHAEFCRSACRNRNRPDSRSYYQGLRVLLAPNPED